MRIGRSLFIVFLLYIIDSILNNVHNMFMSSDGIERPDFERMKRDDPLHYVELLIGNARYHLSLPYPTSLEFDVPDAELSQIYSELAQEVQENSPGIPFGEIMRAHIVSYPESELSQATAILDGLVGNDIFDQAEVLRLQQTVHALVSEHFVDE
jgi:hypothetical protein